MRAFMKKTGLWTCTLVLLGCLFAMGWAQWQLSLIPKEFQAIWLAPAIQEAQQGSGGSGLGDGQMPPGDGGKGATNKALSGAREKAKSISEQLEGACRGATLAAIAAPAAISVKDGASTSARLEGIAEDGYALHPINLYGGRLIYPEEFQQGRRVALVDEQLAVALFQYAEPLERDIQIAGESYRIVGIVRSQKQVGDKQEYSAYVPFLAVERSSVPLTALCLSAEPIQGAGGWAAFCTAVASQQPEATLISLPKEAQGAALPMRILFVAVALGALFTLVRLLNKASKALHVKYQEGLLDEYASKLMPQMLPRGLLLLLGYGACAGLFAWLVTLLLAPVYTFPEWIPTVLVEPKDISAAFWNVWQGMASLMELRSPELIRIRFLERLVGWVSGTAALMVGVLWARGLGLIKAKNKKY